MLNLAKCVVKQTSSYNVDSTLNRLEEGVALVSKMENGVAVATIATGATGEQFIGVSQNRHTMPESAVRDDVGTIPGTAPYTFPLGRAVLGTEVAIYIAGEVAERVTVAPAAGEYLVDGNGVVTFAAADAGKDIAYRFRYNLTQNEANMLFGSDLVSFVRLPDVATSVIEVGLVVTDNYVLEDDWSNAKVAYLGAGGKFTTDNASGVVAGRVAGLPSAFEGFLAVEISV